MQQYYIAREAVMSFFMEVQGSNCIKKSISAMLSYVHIKDGNIFNPQKHPGEVCNMWKQTNVNYGSGNLWDQYTLLVQT